jgi:hypothetical protein
LRIRSVRPAAAGFAGFLILALAACSPGAASPSESDSPVGPGAASGSPSASAGASGGLTASPSASAAEPAARAPLSNAGTTPAIAARSAVAVVVDGDSARGLDRADVVVEEFSDLPRWLGLFQSTDATVGPVASTRPMDPMLLTVLRPVYAFAGGPAGMLKQVRLSGVPAVNSVIHASDFAGAAGRQTASTAKLRTVISAPAAVPILQYVGAEADPAPGMTKARQITIRVAGRPAQVWTYDPARAQWRLSSPGPALAPKNLVLQFVQYKSVQLHHPYGRYVPSARVLGSGRAVVATDGKALDGIWRKAGPTRLTTYATSHGIIARLATGPTVIALVPVGSKVEIR